MTALIYWLRAGLQHDLDGEVCDGKIGITFSGSECVVACNHCGRILGVGDQE